MKQENCKTQNWQRAFMSTFLKFFLVSLSCFISTAYAESYIKNDSGDKIGFYNSKKQLIGSLKPDNQISIPLPSYYTIGKYPYQRFPYDYDGAFEFPKVGGYPNVLYPIGGFIIESYGGYTAKVKAGKTEKTLRGVLGQELVFTPGEIGSTSQFEVTIDIVLGKTIKLSCVPAPNYYDAGYEMAKISGTTLQPKVDSGTSCVRK